MHLARTAAACVTASALLTGAALAEPRQTDSSPKNGGDAARLPALLFDLIQPPKRQLGPPHCLCACQADFQLFFNLTLEMKSQLLIQVCLHGLSPEYGPETIQQIS